MPDWRAAVYRVVGACYGSRMTGNIAQNQSAAENRHHGKNLAHGTTPSTLSAGSIPTVSKRMSRRCRVSDERKISGPMPASIKYDFILRFGQSHALDAIRAMQPIRPMNPLIVAPASVTHLLFKRFGYPGFESPMRRRIEPLFRLPGCR